MTTINTKDEIIDKFIYDLMMPYITFLKITLSEDSVFDKVKKDIDNNKLSETNLNFLMELIKKKIINYN